MGLLKTCLLLTLVTVAIADEEDGRVLSFFNVVKFPNDVCKGSGSRNGTCYTTEECSDRGGTSAGTCADGFGVCCVIQLSCGASTSENCTYLVQTSTTTPGHTACDYKICPMNKNICRIKFDLTTFSIAGPTTQSTFVAAEGTTTIGSAVGDCYGDSFTVASSGGGSSSPVVCGVNTGQHMFVDVSGGDCARASFVFSADSDTREYDIKVLQYDCKNEMGGPMGCLQFFTGTTGTISNYNWQGSSTTGTYSHLSNQNYDICIRREADYCAICYITTATTGAFGLSVSLSDTAAQASIGTSCTADFLEIPNGQAYPLSTTTIAAGNSRYCGRILNPTSAKTTAASVCSLTTPFRLHFYTDEDEVNGNGAKEKGKTDEFSVNPRGNIGFQISYAQQKC